MMVTTCQKQAYSDGAPIPGQYYNNGQIGHLDTSEDRLLAQQSWASGSCDRFLVSTAYRGQLSLYFNRYNCVLSTAFNAGASNGVLPKYTSPSGFTNLVNLLGGPSHISSCVNLQAVGPQGVNKKTRFYPDQEALYNRIYPSNNPSYASLNSTTDKTRLKNFQLDALKFVINEKIGSDRFYFSAIVNDGPAHNCPIGTSQGVGTRYMEFAAMFGSKGKVLPICRPDLYASSLQATAQAIQGLTSASFAMPANAAVINWVKKKVGTTETLLTQAQYQMVGSQLNISAGVLQNGDQVIVNWTAR